MNEKQHNNRNEIRKEINDLSLKLKGEQTKI